jgi:glycosyltransferase involved in cell wall biosynthesis
VKRVLLISYHFPPRGGPGVQRTVKFARYLREFDLEPVVITGPTDGVRSFAPEDETLSAELPADIEVRRLPGPEPGELGGWHGRAHRWLRLESAWDRWWSCGAIAAGREVPAVDVILATMSPFQSAVAGAELSAELGVPWVADLRDPWVLDEMQVYETALHRRLDLRAMGKLLQTAEGIIMNTREAATSVTRAFPALAGRTIVLPNGYDARDFAGDPPARQDNAFRIVHAGYLHTELGRDHSRARLLRKLFGGALGSVDILPRSHVYLTAAVRALLQRRPDLRPLLEIHLVGQLSPGDRSVDSDMIHAHGYLAHARCLEIVRSADLLFLPMHNLDEGYRARIVPGKTYEYLASGRPILAAVPEGDARDLLTDVPTAQVVRPTDVAGMERIIEGHVDGFLLSGRAPTLALDLEAFERRNLTMRLAEFLLAVSAEHDVEVDLAA